MKILKADVEWYKTYHNNAELKILVDRIPKREELRFESKVLGLYFAEKDGYVRFFQYDAPGDGCGGRVFEITMKSGKKIELIGPLSSRSGVMNRCGLTPSVSVQITDNAVVWKDGFTFGSGHITLELALKAVKLARCKLRIIVQKDGEFSFEPYRWIDQCLVCKGFGKYRSYMGEGANMVKCSWCEGKGRAPRFRKGKMVRKGGVIWLNGLWSPQGYSLLLVSQQLRATKS